MRLLSSTRTARGVLAVGLVIVALATVTALLIYTTGGHRPGTTAGAGTPGGSAGSDGSYPDYPVPSGSVSASPSGSVHPSASVSASGSVAPPPAVPPPPPTQGPGAGWALKWAPDPARDGLGAFEGVEDDRAHTDSAHMPHIFVASSAGNSYWEVEMPAWNQEHDTSTDRQRNEVKGMHAGGTNLALLPGQTWRLDWSLYVSRALQATDHFTHIMQLKMPGDGSAPLFTMDLSLSGGVPTIALKVFAEGRTVGSARLAPLQNTWITSSVTFSVAAAPGGSVGWVLRDQNGAMLVNNTVTGVGTYVPSEGDRVRPKWGIYRSLLSNHADLVPCAMYLDNMRGYQKV